MMNLKKYLLPLIPLLLCLPQSILSQDNQDLDTRIADLLVRFPAPDENELKLLMDQMIELDQEGWQRIMEKVAPDGTDGDAGARFATEGLSRYLSQPGRDQERKSWEKAVLDEVEQQEDVHVKRFLISQLNYIGGSLTVERLSVYLSDDRLFDPCIRAMRDADPEAAADIFASHLDNVRGKAQIALINVLGEIGTVDQAASIEKLAGGVDPELQRSVLSSLAKLGNPGSFRTMMSAAESVSFMPDGTGATGSLMGYAEKLAATGRARTALRICRTVQKQCTGPEQVHYRIRALLIAAASGDMQQSVRMLVDAMKDEEKPMRMAAITYALDHGSPVTPWMETIRSAGSPEVRGEILYFFGMLGDTGTAAVVKAFLQDENQGVRQQAAWSLTRILGNGAVDELVAYILKSVEDEELQLARELLLQTVRQDQVPMLVRSLEGAGEGPKVVLLEVIATRGGRLYFPVLFEQIGTGGPVRKSALENLHRVSPGNRLPLLLEMLRQLDQDEEVMHVQHAIVAAVEDSGDRAGAIRSILSFAGEHADPRKSIGVLASLGGKEALDFIYASYRSGDGTAREMAFNALVRSTDIDALPLLYGICESEQPPEERQSAFRSYLRSLGRSALPDDQKLLLLRKIDPLAPGIDEKRQLIRTMGRIRTFLSFITLGKYMEQEELSSDAANALVNVALPSDGLENGLSGPLVREKLRMARDLVTGTDSEYLKVEIDNYLEGMAGGTGFVSMFNGYDLTGWQGLAAEPPEKQGLSPGELEKLQKEADRKLQENWSVRDQCIIFNGRGSNLCSIDEYGSFELIVDWRITRKGDSGIYLRGSPQVQIWDTSRVEVGAQVGSGGLYNNQQHESKPLVVADNPVGDWNTFRIIMADDRVTVYLNGQLVTDNVVMENYWDRSIPIFPRGPIELQAHGTDLAFRDIFIREMEPAANRLTAEEEQEGFRLLFNGRDLEGWTGRNHSYAAEDGCIVIRPSGGGGNLYTEKEYDDFILRFDFRLTPGANNGLGIRAPLEGDAAYAGYELQILDNTAPEYADLAPYQYHGSVYGLIPARRGFLNPVGQWNSQEVTAKGDEIRVVLNGTTILEGNLQEATRNGTADGREHPGLGRTSGHIGFLGHGSLLWFRNIRIQEL